MFYYWLFFCVSISSDNTFKAAIIVFLFVYFFDITVIHNICDNKIVDLIISFMPINALRSWQVTILPTIELGDIRIDWIYILESIEAIIFVFLLYRLININSKNVYRNSWYIILDLKTTKLIKVYYILNRQNRIQHYEG